MAKKKKKAVKAKGGRKTAPSRKTTAPSRKAAQGAWIVTTSGDRAIADVAKDLKAAGFAVDQTLGEIGIITGKSNAKAITKARAVRGVSDVSPDQPVDIGPPNSRETW
jgi:hypothetical protein